MEWDTKPDQVSPITTLIPIEMKMIPNHHLRRQTLLLRNKWYRPFLWFRIRIKFHRVNLFLMLLRRIFSLQPQIIGPKVMVLVRYFMNYFRKVGLLKVRVLKRVVDIVVGYVYLWCWCNAQLINLTMYLSIYLSSIP